MKWHGRLFITLPCPQGCPSVTDVDLNDSLTKAVAATIIATIEHGECVVDELCIRRAAAENPIYQQLLARVLAGEWHQQKSQEDACLHPFYRVRDRLAFVQDLVTYTFKQGCVRLVVPQDFRQQVAANLDTGLQGTDSMLRRARQSVYWPGIEGNLQHHKSSCEACETHTPSLPAETL